jgi:hypothetical protein
MALPLLAVGAIALLAADGGGICGRRTWSGSGMRGDERPQALPVPGRFFLTPPSGRVTIPSALGRFSPTQRSG